MRLPKNFNLLPKYIADDVYKKIGNKIAKDMMDTYRSAIRAFYDDYTPHAYRRRHRSYFFVDPSGTKSYTKLVKPNINGNGFSIRMKISPRNIRVPYQSITGGFSSGLALNNIVFNNTFVLGQHGGRLPWDILPEDSRPIYPTNRWKAYKTGWMWEPPKMETPPKALIDEWFDNYKNSNEIKKIVDSVVINSINRFLKNYKKQYPGGGKK